MDAPGRDAALFMHTYKRLPLEIVRGDGAWLHAQDGTRYLDMFGGIAVNALGHAHPAVVRAITEQAGRYIHLSNYFHQEPQQRLAGALLRASGYSRVFFSNSGTEAIEGAIKIARRWGSSRGRHTLVSLTGAFHGRTMGALSIMDREKYRNGFAPFLPDCRICEFGSIDALREAVDGRTAAVVLEYIQGEGGIRPVSPAYAEALENLRQKHGFLIVADEIQSGIGRTGRFFGFEHFGASPDVVTLAKPLGGGLPLGALLARGEAASVLEPGTHGTTFGGNPVACAAGAAVLHEVTDGGLMRRCADVGELLKSRLEKLQDQFPGLVREVRGFGLMLGMELAIPGDPVVSAMQNRGVLINCTDTTVLRFVPPLIIDAEQIEIACAALSQSLAETPA
jgi:predicted acetylornithine/succinylornithine family transaminase